MTDISNVTLKQLVADRPDLVADIKAGKDEGTISASIVKDAKGRMGIWTEETKDLDGKVTRKRIDNYSYYPTGEINEIVQERHEAGKLVKKQSVKHYLDGTQPDVTPIAISEEIPK